MIVRPAVAADSPASWRILEPVIRAGETYALPRDLSHDEALAYWFSSEYEVFVAEVDGEVLGTYHLRPNRASGGAHVANCGYVTLTTATGRGIARAMCEHSLEHARRRGFRSMQFNFVVSTNTRAVGLWQSCGFEIVGRLPEAFCHPSMGFVDAYVMFRHL
ncbi:MAG: N-acetyltransferase family protein [Terriglobales bacterium]